ncbi:hypothetical protein [uncultured Vagococcus sp.]|uniref:hypothetical protein n=1 Tax=uncultured Vagococcus sp. TaxID=189676 RepID=UPI0028D0E9B2|nr:hypothetical protein [uncultured Vagococcus sp.]
MKKQSKSRVLLVVILIVAGLMLVNKTQAWLLAKTEERANQFTVGKVAHEIEEEFDQTQKTNVKVTNTGNTDAFIRVKLVPQWLDETATKSLGLATANTYEIVFNEVDWIESGGFWYCRQSVAAGAQTPILVKSTKPKAQLAEEYKGKVFTLEVVAQSVQSSPIEAVTELWGFDPSK